jgi:hypothetical protein
MRATMDAELEEVLADLGPHEQQEVLDYARSLLDADEDDDGVPRMVHMVGSISREDLRLMKEGLEEDGLTGLILVRFLGFVPDEELQRMRSSAPGASGEESGEASEDDADEGAADDEDDPADAGESDDGGEAEEGEDAAAA